MTKDTEAAGSKGCCIFPFKYSGVTYYKCSTAGGFASDPWCAYQVESDGITMTTNKWAYCEDYCKTQTFSGR